MRTKHFGILLVIGFNRVPKPALNRIAFNYTTKYLISGFLKFTFNTKSKYTQAKD